MMDKAQQRKLLKLPKNLCYLQQNIKVSWLHAPTSATHKLMNCHYTHLLNTSLAINIIFLPCLIDNPKTVINKLGFAGNQATWYPVVINHQSNAIIKIIHLNNSLQNIIHYKTINNVNEYWYHVHITAYTNKLVCFVRCTVIPRKFL